MADRSLRGADLDSKRFASESGIEFAKRQDIGFECASNHNFLITFAAEADLPTTWECPKCGKPAKRSDGVVGEEKPAKPQRTHWDMLRERRSINDLEEILGEQLDKLRNDD